ncbi:hypothetical protein ABWH91_11385 [Phycisphaerales bacterium ac7]
MDRSASVAPGRLTIATVRSTNRRFGSASVRPTVAPITFEALVEKSLRARANWASNVATETLPAAVFCEVFTPAPALVQKAKSDAPGTVPVSWLGETAAEPATWVGKNGSTSREAFRTGAIAKALPQLEVKSTRSTTYRTFCWA